LAFAYSDKASVLKDNTSYLLEHPTTPNGYDTRPTICEFG